MSYCDDFSPRERRAVKVVIAMLREKGFVSYRLLAGLDQDSCSGYTVSLGVFYPVVLDTLDVALAESPIQHCDYDHRRISGRFPRFALGFPTIKTGKKIHKGYNG